MKAETPVRDSSSRLPDRPSAVQIQLPPTHHRLKCDCSLGSLVRELLHPLLKDWLDRNLAEIVEKCVDEEIKRMART
jgi:hypothetical protein